MSNYRSKIVKLSYYDLLTDTIRVNNLQSIRYLVNNGADVNERGKNMSTPLHVAVQYGRVEIVKFLIEQGALVDATLAGREQHGLTPLHLAVKKDNLECAKILLQKGASVSSKIKGTCHPIHFAVAYNYPKMVELLLKNGADMNLRFSNEFFEEYRPGTFRSAWLDHDLPLIHYAILYQHNSIAFLLYEQGADVNIKTNLGKTLLMQAVEANSVYWVKTLVKEKNANVNDHDISGQPVLHFLLLNKSKKVSVTNMELKLFSWEKLIIFKYLIHKGVDVNARFPEDNERGSIIHYMIKFGFYDGVQYLLFNRGDLNFNEIDLTSLYSARLVDNNLCPRFDWDYTYRFNIRYRKIVYDIIKKAISLREIGYFVNHSLILKEPILSYVTLENHTSLCDSIEESIKKEINFLKEKTIGDSKVTLWQLVTCKTDKFIKLLPYRMIRDYKLDNIQKIKNKAYIYYGVLEKRLRDARNRKLFLEKWTEFISSLLSPDVPYDCCEKITNFLNEQDIII